MKIIFDNMIRVTDMPEAMKAEIKKALSLPNAIFFKMKKMGKYVGHLSPEIKYYSYDKETGTLLLPRGVLRRLKDYCSKQGIHYTLDDRRPFGESKKYQGEKGLSRVTLRDYQIGVLDEILKQDEGIIRLGTGYGKSCLILGLAEILQLPTLIIVPRKTLKEAFETDIKKYFGKEHQITVTTIQSLQRKLSKVNYVNEDKEKYGLIAADECHGYTTDKCRKVIHSFSPRYLFGASGTARRSDGQGEALKFIFGPILVDKDLPRESPTVEIYKYNGHLLSGPYGDIIERQVNDEQRNRFIATILLEKAAQGRKILCLVKRIEMYNQLLDNIRVIETERPDLLSPSRCPAIAIRSSDSPSALATQLADLRSGVLDFSILLGTFSGCATGLDIPQICTIVFAGDLRSDVLQEQGIGRALRLLDSSKQRPLIVDVVDTGNKILSYQGRLREQFYRSKGWELVDANQMKD